MARLANRTERHISNKADTIKEIKKAKSDEIQRKSSVLEGERVNMYKCSGGKAMIHENIVKRKH